MTIISEKTCDNVKVIQNSTNQWAVTDLAGNTIVPFGKYAWIDGFDHGLARVRGFGELNYYKNVVALIDDDGIITDKEMIKQRHEEDYKAHPEKFSKWGIINEKGEEVVPVEYDEIWKFYGKNLESTKVVKDGVAKQVYFRDLNPNLPKNNSFQQEYNNKYNAHDDYGHNYGEFVGTYAQDVMGYSDDLINDAFEGDPDAYWNID